MKWALKLAIVFFAVLDGFLAVFLATGFYRDAQMSRARRDELTQWVGDSEGLPQELRRELYDLKTGEALKYTYVQGECDATDGQIHLRFSNDEKSECSVSLTLIELDTGRTIAQTDLLDPGYRVESMEMLEILPPGQYECYAQLHYYWMRNDAFLGTAARQVLLTVQ